MANFLMFYGSYRHDRKGIRLARFLTDAVKKRGHEVELVDAQEIGLPMLDRMYKEYPAGEAPPPMARLAELIVAADGFLFVVGEYNWSVQPGLKNLTDHYLEEWSGRPAAIASYSAGRLAGVRAATAWHSILAEMGMAVVPRTLAVGLIESTLDEQGIPSGEGGQALIRSTPKFLADLEWWAAAAEGQRASAVLP
jgi:NAD(P)H-dependent FMN reductase